MINISLINIIILYYSMSPKLNRQYWQTSFCQLPHGMPVHGSTYMYSTVYIHSTCTSYNIMPVCLSPSLRFFSLILECANPLNTIFKTVLILRQSVPLGKNTQVCHRLMSRSVNTILDLYITARCVNALLINLSAMIIICSNSYKL